MNVSERIDAELKKQMVFPVSKCKCCSPERPYRPRNPVPSDPEGDRLAASVVRRFMDRNGNFIGTSRYRHLTMDQRRAMLGPKKPKKRWDGGSPP